MEFAALIRHAWFTLAVVVTMFLVLIFTKLRTDVAFLCVIVALYVSGVLDVKGTFGGFCSNSVLVVAAMYCVIAGLTHTGVLKWVVRHLMGHPKSLNSAIVRVMVPVAALSSEQYHRRGSFRECGEDVVQKTGDTSFKAAYPPELCLRNGRYLHDSGNSAEPDYPGGEHLHLYASFPVLN